MKSPRRRGLSLVELMLSLTLTGLVAAGIAGMLTAVSSGAGTRRDARSASLMGHALTARITAYVAPSRALLDVDEDRFVLWRHDDRESETVHASEIRWFKHDPSEGSLRVHFVVFPAEWTQTAVHLEDREYAMDTDWWMVFDHFERIDLINSRPLADGIIEMEVFMDQPVATESRHLSIGLVIAGAHQPLHTLIPATILDHRPPSH